MRMLHREVELRKAEETQQAFERAEESVDSEWMEVVSKLQYQVVAEFFDQCSEEEQAWLSVHELRLAAQRHPEICFWVEFNRARRGDLRVGDVAPDVSLVDALSGSETSLLRQTKQGKPCVVVAGSLS